MRAAIKSGQVSKNPWLSHAHFQREATFLGDDEAAKAARPGQVCHSARLDLAGIHHPDHNRYAQLTAREIEVLREISKGLSNKAVAEALKITEDTVKVHVNKILSKLNAASRTEAAIWAIQAGLISPDEDD